MLKKLTTNVIVVLLVLLAQLQIVYADTVHPSHNSRFYLQYATGETVCTDYYKAHSYWTIGNASNTYCRLSVYILNSSGTIVASDSSTDYDTYASAWWTRSFSTFHVHRASSAMIGK